MAILRMRLTVSPSALGALDGERRLQAGAAEATGLQAALHAVMISKEEPRIIGVAVL